MAAKMKPHEKMVRKQFFLCPEQIKKLESIARKEGMSVSEIFRMAIDAYNSNITTDIIDPELLNLVSARVKTALADTKKINQKLQNTLKTLDLDQRLSKLESF